VTAVLLLFVTLAEKVVACPIVTVAVVGETDTDTLLAGGGGGGGGVWPGGGTASLPAPPQLVRARQIHNMNSETQ
jgi:hypothetical protein